MSIPGMREASAKSMGNATIPAPNRALQVFKTVDRKETDCGSKRHPGATDSETEVLNALAEGYLSMK